MTDLEKAKFEFALNRLEQSRKLSANKEAYEEYVDNPKYLRDYRTLQFKTESEALYKESITDDVTDSYFG